MNVVLSAADCLPRGGRVTVDTPNELSAPPRFGITGQGTVVRLTPESERALLGEPAGSLDGRSIQPYLTYQLAKTVNAGLSVTAAPGEVRFTAG
jgi:histidine phosphotransferase ChpT